MNVQNNLTGYINVFLENTIQQNYEENYGEDEVEVNDAQVIEVLDESHIILEVDESHVILEMNDATDSEDEETVIEKFDVNQLNEYHDDDETVNYDDVEEDTDEETIPNVPHITDEMKDCYCRFYVQHVYCYLKSWHTQRFDDICQNEYEGDFERCVMDYMMPFVFDQVNFNNWLFDYAYRFDNSLNYLVQYLQEMERTDLINMLHEAIPPER